MKLTITAYSTALFSTWYFIEELGLLFDAGDGVSAGLLQKSRKVKNILISHADRDHITGLLQFNQLNARSGLPVIHYPKDSSSFPAMEAFFKKFDPHMGGAVWKPIKNGSHIQIKEKIYAEVIRNGHVPVEEKIQKSFSFQLYSIKRKLKSKYQQLPKNEIEKMVLAEGKESMTEEVRTNLLAYSGDTPVEDTNRFTNANILIHEATFLHDEEKSQGNRHSKLEDVIEMVSQTNIKQLILGHFSSRYSKLEIETTVRSLCKKYELNIPVTCVFPGQIHRNILQEKPIHE